MNAAFPFDPSPEEAYEGLGDYLLAGMGFWAGSIASFIMAMIVGITVFGRFAYPAVRLAPSLTASDSPESESGR